jgi:protein-S-isoprenylcysteine O-methyltransferase Ste14
MAEDHGPGVRIPPPLLLAGVMAGAWALDQLWSVPIGPAAPELGGMLAALALVLIGWAVVVLVRAGNDPRPDRPDTAMTLAGPYRFGRNPIYLGFLLIATGFALAWGTLFPWLGVVLLHGLLDRLVIAREEAYLEARFGEPYRAYRARVRRWM